MAQVDKFLNFLVKNSGSDLHLVTGTPPIVRIDGNLQKMRELRESVFPYLVNLGETEEEIAAVTERLQMRFEATQHSIMGDILFSLGMREQALVEYNNAVLKDPKSADWLNAMRLF